MPADAKSDVKGDAKGDDGKGSADAQAGPGSSVPESSALNTQFDTEEEAPLFRVPRLDDLCVQALAQNLAKFPNLDHIKEEYVAAVVELVDTKSIPFTVASKYIENEKFWEKSVVERWPDRPHQLVEHGMSWRRMYAEQHLAEQLERYYPSRDGGNLESLLTQVRAARPVVQTIKFRQLRAKLDLHKVLADFQNLQTLDLRYGNKDIGMRYEKTMFGMNLNDAMSLSQLVSNCNTLTRLVLAENLLGDESIQVLSTGLAKNNTITYLDLSHNKIGDLGAQRLAHLLSQGSLLLDLNLSDNKIRNPGVKQLATALSRNMVLGSLSLRLNAFSDRGGATMLDALADNDSLTELDLAANDLSEQTSRALLRLLSKNQSLTSLDLAANSVVEGKGDRLLAALELNKSLTKLDLRQNSDKKTLESISAVLRPRAVKMKQATRKGYQAGWDELDN